MDFWDRINVQVESLLRFGPDDLQRGGLTECVTVSWLPGRGDTFMKKVF